MLESWNISQEHTYLVISDNANNMVKAIRDASLVHLACFAHSVQLVVKEELLSKRAIADINAIHKSIVGHFYQLSVASHSLNRIQESLSIHASAQVEERYNHQVEFHS